MQDGDRCCLKYHFPRCTLLQSAKVPRAVFTSPASRALPKDPTAPVQPTCLHSLSSAAGRPGLTLHACNLLAGGACPPPSSLPIPSASTQPSLLKTQLALSRPPGILPSPSPSRPPAPPPPAPPTLFSVHAYFSPPGLPWSLPALDRELPETWIKSATSTLIVLTLFLCDSCVCHTKGKATPRWSLNAHVPEPLFPCHALALSPDGPPKPNKSCVR